MTRIYIEVRGGVVASVQSTEPIEFCLIDWDNINAGDTASWTNIYGPDRVASADTIELEFMNEGLKK